MKISGIQGCKGSKIIPPELLHTRTHDCALVGGTLVQRYKRFLADVRLNTGELVTAHCANTGSMENLTLPGTRVWLAPAQNPERKLRWTWMFAELADGIYGVDTAYPNRMTGELLRAGALAFLGDWSIIRPERPYGERSRIDFLCENGDQRLYLEVKNCHLAYGDGYGYFPDCQSQRATTHLHELSVMAAMPRTRAAILFFAQLPHLTAVRPSDAHDPPFAAAARLAHRNGVEFYAIQAVHAHTQTTFRGPYPVDLQPYDYATITDRRMTWKALTATR